MVKEIFTTHDISKLLGVSPLSVVNWIKQGLLKSYRTPGGHRRVKRADLLSFLKSQGMIVPESLIHPEKKILIVDDDPDLLYFLEGVLRDNRENFEVRASINGIDALLEIGRWHPDIILLDLFMPEVDGFEVCKRLKNDPETSDIRVIAITGLFSQENKKRIIELGAEDVIVKPIKPELLLKKIDNVL